MKIALMTATVMLMTTTAFAGNPSGTVIGQKGLEPSKNQQLTSRQRADIARQIVRKWGPQIQREGGDVRAWALKMGSRIGTVDASNARNAALMPSIQTMMGALSGQSVNTPAMRKGIEAAYKGQIAASNLASTIADTTYTPLPDGRCRVADSRVISTPTVPSAVIPIDVEGVASYAAQGGNGSSAGDGSANCGIPDGTSAYAISVTVLPPAGQTGIFKIFENGKSYTEGNTVSFTSGDFAVSNDVIVRGCSTCEAELSVLSSGAVDYVIDIVGYFAPAQAAALQCTTTFVSQSTEPNFPFDIQIPVCPVGYTVTGAGCRTSGFSEVNWSINGLYTSPSGSLNTFCSGENTTAGTVTVEGTAQCCRVPGR